MASTKQLRSKDPVALKKKKTRSQEGQAKCLTEGKNKDKSRTRSLATKVAALGTRETCAPPKSSGIDAILQTHPKIRNRADKPPLPRPGQTFGAHEGPEERSEEECVQNAFNEPGWVSVYNLCGEEGKWRMIEAVKHNFRNPDGYGAHPEADDPTVRYTVLDWPKPDGSGTRRLTLRWWSGRKLGYYFDIVDTRNGKVRKPPKGFQITAHSEGASIYIPTQESIMKGLSRTFEFKKNADGYVEERWVVPSGSKVVIYSGATKVAMVYAPRSDDEEGDDHLPMLDVKRAEEFE